MKKPRLIAGLAVGAAAAAAVCLTLDGCAPPFLEALDRAAALTHQMTQVGTIGTVNLENGSTNVRLLPPKPTSTVTSISQVKVQSGFLVSDNPGGEVVTYAYVDSSGNVQNANGLAAMSLAGADPHYPLYQYEVAATTTTANLVVVRMDPNNASLDTAVLLAAGLPPAGSLSFVPSAFPPYPTLSSFNAGGYSVLGESVVPTLNGGADAFQWLLADGLGNFGQVSAQLNAGSVFTNIGAPALAGVGYPTGIARFMYYSQAKSYLEYYSGGWICLDISGAPVQLTGVTHRIDALLTNGELLSTENDTLTLYDPNGSQLLTMPMGGLRFCYEAYVGTTPYCFFSLAMSVQHGNWIFAVYAIPTSQMRGL